MKVVDSGSKSALEQMQIDEALLLDGVQHPLLRFYDWSSNAVTYGYFINPSDWLKIVPENCARRPTGGGLIFHEGDFSFTLALPPEHALAQKPVLERYQIINSAVLQVISSLVPDCEPGCEMTLQLQKQEGVLDQLCMANPTQYDLLLGAKKIGGAAQRKNKRAFIHQCSLILTLPDWQRIARELVDPEHVLPKLQAFTGSLFPDKAAINANFRDMLKAALQQYIKKIASFR